MGLFDRFKSKKAEPPGELEEMMRRMNAMAFPGGEAQIEKESDEIYKLLAGKVSREDAKYILTRSKSLLVISEDKSEQRIATSIHQSAGGKLTKGGVYTRKYKPPLSEFRNVCQTPKPASRRLVIASGMRMVT